MDKQISITFSHNLLKKPFQFPPPPGLNFLASFKMDFSFLSAEDTHIWGGGGEGNKNEMPPGITQILLWVNILKVE